MSVLAPEVHRKMIRLNPEGTTFEEAASELVKQLAADCVL